MCLAHASVPMMAYSWRWSRDCFNKLYAIQRRNRKDKIRLYKSTRTLSIATADGIAIGLQLWVVSQVPVELLRVENEELNDYGCPMWKIFFQEDITTTQIIAVTNDYW